MNLIIPFEKVVKFDTPVSEISSISLEHEITKNEKEVLGNFIIKGTYKEYELSLNKKDFSFTLPFSVEIASNIDINTLDFTVDNFTYDLKDKDLTVKIDYIVKADEKKEEVSFEKTDRLPEPIDLIEERNDAMEMPEVKEKPITEDKINDNIMKIIENYKVKVFTLSNSYVLNNPNIMYDNKKDNLSHIIKSLDQAILKIISDNKINLFNLSNHYILNNPSLLYQKYIDKLNNLTSRVVLLNPMETLKRGYTITRIKDNVVSSIKEIKENDTMLVEFKDGKVETKVVKVCE